VINWLWYHWHRWQANRLNREAKELSALMRSHSDPKVRSIAAIDLLEIGRESNRHEDWRDYYAKKLKSGGK